MRLLKSLTLTLLLLGSLSSRLTLFAPLRDPDASRLEQPSLWPFSAPPPAPPDPPYVPEPPDGWRPPLWSEQGTTSRPPHFAISTWSFPSASTMFQFYWNSSVLASLAPRPAPPSRLRQLSRAWAFRLADTCPDALVARHIRSLVNETETIQVPLVLHRVFLQDRAVWVLVFAYAYPSDTQWLSFQGLTIEIIRPWSGETFARDSACLCSPV